MKWLIFFSLMTSLGLANANEIERDSGIYGPSYEQILLDLETYGTNYEQAIDFSMGISEQGREMVALLIGNFEVGINKLVTITGSTHGNEYLGIADNIIPHFLDADNVWVQGYLASGGVIAVMPVLNPDGYVARTRGNANGKDLNRDFPNAPSGHAGLTQVETQNVVETVEAFVEATGASFEVAVDYHCCGSALLYPWSYTSSRIPEVDLTKHIQIAELMLAFFPGYRHGITGEVLGYYPVGTSKDYWYGKYGARAFTFEGEYGRENLKLEQHVSWWNSIFRSLTRSK